MTPPAHQALAEDDLGIALLHIQRGDHDAAATCIQTAITDGVSVGANASLFHGAPAVEFVLNCAGRPRRDVTQAVDRVVADRLAAARKRHEAGDSPALAEFDLIRGLTGLGVLLLTRDNDGQLLREILTYLVELVEPVQHRDGWQLPGWWCATGPKDEPLPGGHGNNGVAHGIAGPLALMSLAVRTGFEVSGLRDAIDLCAGWLEGPYGGFYWVTRNDLAEDRPALPSRPSWCYGALGTARARQLAAIALNEPHRRQQAEKAALAALTGHPMIDRLTTSTGLCHGWAGQLAVTRALAADARGSKRFNQQLGYLEAKTAAGMESVSKSGFLEGSAGVELVLHGPDTIGWSRALLIN